MLISDTVLPTGMPNFRICAFMTGPRLLCAWPLGAIFSALRVSINEQWNLQIYNLFINYFGASSGILKSAKGTVNLCSSCRVQHWHRHYGRRGGRSQGADSLGLGTPAGVLRLGLRRLLLRRSVFFGERGVADCEGTGSRGFQTPASALRTGLSDSVVAAGTSSCLLWGHREQSGER